MNHIKIIISGIILTLCQMGLMAQNAEDSVKIIYRNSQAVVKLDGSSGLSTVKFEEGTKRVKVSVQHTNTGELPATMPADTSSHKKTFDWHFKSRKEKRRQVETDFASELDLGFASLPGNGTLGAPYQNFEMNTGKSVNISFTAISADVNIYKHKVYFKTGFGWNSYYFKPTNKSTIFDLDPTGNYITADADSTQYRKNRLDISYMKIPLMLCYESNPDDDGNSFRMAAGVEYNFASNIDIVRKFRNDNEYSNYSKVDVNLKANPTAWNAIVKIGYGPVTIFGRYGLTNVFKSNAFVGGLDQQLHPVSFGISLFGV